MIIEGLILTNNGPVEIAELKVGDMVLNQMHRAFPVKSITKHEVKEGYTFKKNAKCLVTKGTKIKTAYGDKKVESLTKMQTYIPQPDMRQIKDKAVKKKCDAYAYDLVIEGSTSLFCSNYGIELEGE